MVRLPITPYWTNAAQWWMDNHNSNTHEFNQWLCVQGVTLQPFRPHSYPWIEFEDHELAALFILRWA
jgi:hypothetical protein